MPTICKHCGEYNCDCEAREETVLTKTRTFTCNDCGVSGSTRWMDRHDCARNQELNETGGRCEDYPACGHTDGDGCYALESHTSDFWHDFIQDRRDAGYDDYDLDMMFARMDGEY